MNDEEKKEQRRRIEALSSELRAIRHDIHKHPETAYKENRTAAIVAEWLEKWGQVQGCEAGQLHNVEGLGPKKLRKLM